MDQIKPMNIIVCIKQVPDAKDVRLDPKTNTMAREGVESIMNPFDRHALEEGVRLKELYGGTVTALSMGPPQAEAVLRDAVSCGADEAVLVSDRAFAGADTWATTYTLAKAIQVNGPFDLIICGKQAIDGDTAQVGPGLGKRLDIPYVSYIRKITGFADGVLAMHRLMDDGYDEVEMPLPGLITGADPGSIGLRGSTSQVVKVFAPEFKGERAMLEGNVEEQVEQLLNKIEPYL
jgi:electron transfer flavoprotein beta subunit